MIKTKWIMLFMVGCFLLPLESKASPEVPQTDQSVLATPSQAEPFKANPAAAPQPKSIAEVKTIQFGDVPQAKPYELPKQAVVVRPYDGKEAVEKKGDALLAPEGTEVPENKVKEFFAGFGKLFLKLFKGSSIHVGV